VRDWRSVDSARRGTRLPASGAVDVARTGRSARDGRSGRVADDFPVAKFLGEQADLFTQFSHHTDRLSMDAAAGQRHIGRPDHDRAQAAEPLQQRLPDVDVLDAVELDVVDFE